MTEKVDFITGCPVKGCKNSKKSIEWIHSSCGGKESLDEKGYIECKKCGKKFSILNTTFNCNNHESEKPDFHSLSEIFTLASSSNEWKNDFLKSLLNNIIVN